MPGPGRILRFTLRAGMVEVAFAGAVASSRLLLGRTPQEAVALIGLVHNLCAQAHRAVAAAACGLPLAETVGRGVMIEILREHLIVLCRAAPPLLGLSPLPLPPGIPQLEASLAAPEAKAELLARCLVRSSVRSLARSLARSLFEADAAAPFCLEMAPRAGLLAPFFAALAAGEVASGLAGRRFALGRDPTFFARISGEPDFVPPTGLGPLSERLLGRLYEVHRLIGALGTPAEAAYAPEITAPGTARIAAARGRLAHSVVVAGGGITAYSIETPTALMLAPGGALESFMAALAEAPGASEAILRLGLLAFDPCLAHRISRSPERSLADA